MLEGSSNRVQDSQSSRNMGHECFCVNVVICLAVILGPGIPQRIVHGRSRLGQHGGSAGIPLEDGVVAAADTPDAHARVGQLILEQGPLQGERPSVCRSQELETWFF